MEEMTLEQIEELKKNIEEQKPVPISLHMTTFGFDFVVNSLRILDRAKYKEENGIVLVNKHSTLGKYQCRIIYSDESSEVINLREEK